MLRCPRTGPWSPTARGSPGREQSGHLGLVRLIADERRTESCRNEAMHLACAWVSFEGCLREEQLAIERHLEPAAAARQQHRPGDPRRPRVEELSHQTGGSIRVVSDDAELDLEIMRSVGRLGVHARTLRCDACRRHPPTPGAHRDGPGTTAISVAPTSVPGRPHVGMSGGSMSRSGKDAAANHSRDRRTESLGLGGPVVSERVVDEGR